MEPVLGPRQQTPRGPGVASALFGGISSLQGPLQIPSTLINPVRPGVDTSQLGSPRTGGINNLTLSGLSMNPPTQQATLPSPMMGGGFGQFQPMSNGFGQSQPMEGGGLRSLLDNYFFNFLTNYFQQNLR